MIHKIPNCINVENEIGNTGPMDCPTISLDDTLPDGVVNVAYSSQISSIPADTYIYSLTSGSLPNGLTLSSNGQITGTPTQSGTFNFEIIAADTNGCMGSRAYSVVIHTDNSGLKFQRASGTLTGYVIIPASNSFALSAFTFEFWFKPVYPPSWAGYVMNYHNVLGNEGGTPSRGMVIREGNYLDINGWSSYRLYPMGIYFVSGWNHIAISGDGTDVRVFLNGQVTATGPGAVILDSPADFWLGQASAAATNEYYSSVDGTMRYFRISNIKRYTSDFTPSMVLTSDANTVALLPLLDGSGTTAADVSGHGHDGTLTAGLHGAIPPIWVT